MHLFSGSEVPKLKIKYCVLLILSEIPLPLRLANRSPQTHQDLTP